MHILWQLICGNDAKSCLNKECRANGQGDDDGGSPLSWHMIIDCAAASSIDEQLKGDFKCILHWVAGDILFCLLVNRRSCSYAWREREISNEVQITLLFRFVIFCFVFDALGRRRELTKSILAASQHLCEYLRVIMYHLHNLRTRSLILLRPTRPSSIHRRHRLKGKQENWQAIELCESEESTLEKCSSVGLKHFADTR